MVGAATAAIAVGALFWPHGEEDGSSQTTPQGASTAAPLATGTAATSISAHPTHGSNPFDQAARLLELGVSGDLSIDTHTRGALDVLLASLGSPPAPVELQVLEDALRRAMPGEAATQAMALVRRYVNYTSAAAADSATQQAPSTPDELKALLDKTIALRRKHFDADTAQALFGAEEAQTRHALAVQAIEADPQLSQADKAARIKTLRDQLPPQVASHEAPTSLAMSEMDAKVDTLRQQGAPAAQIEQVRQRYIGAEAARSLGEMEAERARWESRYQAFLQQKKALRATGAADMNAQLEALLRQHYSDEELLAARAYDRAQHP
jgi:lipase chaperone LimK